MFLVFSSWILSACAQDEARTEQCSLSNLSLPTCTPNDRQSWAVFCHQMFMYHKKKSEKDKRKCFACTFLTVNAASPNHFSTTFHFCKFFLGAVVLWQKYITAAAFSRDWTTGIMWKEVLSSCSGLFLFAFATPVCSAHSDAMPSLNLLTSFSQFHVYFSIHPLTNC